MPIHMDLELRRFYKLIAYFTRYIIMPLNMVLELIMRNKLIAFMTKLAWCKNR